MPILTHSDRLPARVHSVREVVLPIAFDRQTETEWFYVEVLGLAPWPAACQIPGGWGAGDLRRGAMFQFRHDPSADPLRRRMTLLVDSISELADRLLANRWPFIRRTGLIGCHQALLLADPTGHQLEIREVRWL